MGRSPQPVSFRFSSNFPSKPLRKRLFSAKISQALLACEIFGLKTLQIRKVMRHAGTVLLLICASVRLCCADVVGTLNIHTASDGPRTTGRDRGQPIPVQVDFSTTEDGTYEITVWSGDHQFGKITRVDVKDGKATLRGENNQTGPITIYCPATDPQRNGPTSFQVFVQAVLDDTNKGGRVQIAEADWQLSSVEDNQPGKNIEPRPIRCSAGSGLDQHATGSFLIKNESDKLTRATLFFGGRKYGDYNLSSHGNQKIQADAWGVNPGVGWYVTTPSPFSPDGKQIEAAGPINNSEAGLEAGFNTVELDDPSSTPTPRPLVSPADKP